MVAAGGWWLQVDKVTLTACIVAACEAVLDAISHRVGKEGRITGM